MPKVINVLLLALLLSVTSCFEVVEEVDLNENGSGSFKFTINMSKSKKEIDAALLLDSIGTIDVPSRDFVDARMMQGNHILTSSKGITNVAIKKDYTNYIFELSFDFDHLSSLNNAIEKLYAQLSSFNYPFAGTFRRSDEKFVRVMDRQSKEILQKMQESNPEMTRESTYTAIYRFVESVSGATNENARISGSQKAVMLRFNIGELATGRKTLNNEIKFK